MQVGSESSLVERLGQTLSWIAIPADRRTISDAIAALEGDEEIAKMLVNEADCLWETSPNSTAIPVMRQAAARLTPKDPHPCK